MHRLAGIRYLSIVICGVATSPGLLATAAHGQVFVTTWDNDTVAEYSQSGGFNPSFISGLHAPESIAISGPDIFVGNADTLSIGEYTTSGAVVNPALITGVNRPYGIAVSGSHLFVLDWAAGTVGEFTTSGQTINRQLITGLTKPYGIAVSGSDLYVAQLYNVGKYTTSGQTIDPNFITFIPNQVEYFNGVAVSGSNVFVVSNGTNSVWEYSTSGALVKANLITGLENPQGIAVSGSHLFVACYGVHSHVGEYTTSGETINPFLMTTGGIDYNVAVAGPPGDTNNDGVVNFDDLLAVAQHYGQPGAFGDGDLNGDGTVNFADLLLLAQNYGQTAFAAQSADSVPEPSSIALLPIAFALRRRRRMRSARC
jgi:hypothetical protein